MEKELAHILDKADRLLVVGVGNVLKSDDGVGVVICRQIKESEQISTLPVEVSIENYIGKINSMDPGALLILDCMELGADPGAYRLLPLDEVEDLTFNTHNISLNRLGEFFKCPTSILGIQPQNVEFGEKLSPAVQKSADRIIRQINQKNKRS